MNLLDGFDFNTIESVQGAFDGEDLPPEHIALLAELDKASREDNLTAVRELFQLLRGRNASYTVLSKPGSALRLAIERQNDKIVRYLLSEGVQISANHVRIATSIRAQDVLEQLLRNGWPVNEPLGWSDPPALAYAVEDLELTVWFLASGADPNTPCCLDKTPLSAAVQYGPLSVIETLFAHGGSIGNGQLLHYAIWREQSDRSTVIQYILDKGAPVNAVMYHDHRDSYLQRERFGLGTPLHDAAAAGDTPVLQMLLEAGADVRTKDSLGYLAHERAQANGHETAAQLLLRLFDRG